jgi:hypothetical protein
VPGLTGGHGFPWSKVQPRTTSGGPRARAAIFPDRGATGPIPGCRRGPGVSGAGTPRAASPRLWSCPHRWPVRSDQRVVGAIKMGPSTVWPVATLVMEHVITRRSGICPWKRPWGDTTTGVPMLPTVAKRPGGDVTRNGGRLGQLIRKVSVEFCGVLRCPGRGGCPGTCQRGYDGRRQGDYDAPHVSLPFVECGRLDRRAWTSQKAHTSRMRSCRFLTWPFGPGHRRVCLM